ncbi:hypothetical protein [Sphingomonas sp.]
MSKDAILIAMTITISSFYIIRALDGLTDKVTRLVDVLHERKP